MRAPHRLAVFGLALLCGCSSDLSVRKDASALAGSYRQVDAILGDVIVVDLAADGSFTSHYDGCMGEYGRANGTWTVEGDQILFSPVVEGVDEHDMLRGYLTRATTLSQSGRLGFAREQDLKDGKVPYDQKFRKQRR